MTLHTLTLLVGDREGHPAGTEFHTSNPHRQWLKWSCEAGGLT